MTPSLSVSVWARQPATPGRVWYTHTGRPALQCSAATAASTSTSAVSHMCFAPDRGAWGLPADHARNPWLLFPVLCPVVHAVEEYVGKGDILNDCISHPDKYTERHVAVALTRPLLQALAHLHANNIIHRCAPCQQQLLATQCMLCDSVPSCHGCLCCAAVCKPAASLL